MPRTTHRVPLTLVLVTVAAALASACDAHGPCEEADSSTPPARDAGMRPADARVPPVGPRDDAAAPAPDAGVMEPPPGCGVPPAPSGAVPIFQDDFETGDLTHSDSGFTWRGSQPVSDAYGCSGDHAARFRYGPDAPGEDSQSELRFNLAPEGTTDIDRVWIEFMLRVPDNFYHRNDVSSDNNKLFSLWAEHYDNRDGDAEFTYEYIRGSVEGESLPRMSVITDGDPSTHIGSEHYAVRRDPLIGFADRGRWVRIGIMALITDDVTREVAQVWKDGEKVMAMVGLSSFTPGGSNWLRTGYVLGWSNSGFTEETDFYVDDFTVYIADPGWE